MDAKTIRKGGGTNNRVVETIEPATTILRRKGRIRTETAAIGTMGLRRRDHTPRKPGRKRLNDRVRLCSSPLKLRS